MAGPREQVFAAQPFAYASQRVIASPFQFATTEDDNLQIVSANSLAGVVLAIQGRRLTTAGAIEPFAFVHTPNTDRSSKTENYKLGGGALLNLIVFAVSGTPRIGQTYVSARIVRGLSSVTVLLGALLGGYVTAAQPLAFPGSPILSSLEGGGYVRELTGTDPAAGVECAETVPTGARWELLTFRATFITDATVATRRPSFITISGGITLFRSPSPTTFPASTGGQFYWMQGMPHATAVLGSIGTAGLPTPTVLLAGGMFQTVTDNITAGDDYSSVRYTVREWLEVQS